MKKLLLGGVVALAAVAAVVTVALAHNGGNGKVPEGPPRWVPGGPGDLHDGQRQVQDQGQR